MAADTSDRLNRGTGVSTSVTLTLSGSKQQFDLGEVQETLLIPLYFRARESARPDAIVRDPYAQRIVSTLRYDFSRFDEGKYIGLDCVIRSEILDQQVQKFLAEHPDAVVINLGAGLDARFWRVDDGRVRWFDLDMPDAIALRRQFLDDGPRNRSIASSMLEPAWLQAVDAPSGTPVLVIAEGLFCYFVESQIRQLFAMLASRWPGVQLLFQSISPQYVASEQSLPALNRTRARLLWGINSGREIEQWDAGYRFLNEWSFIDRHRSRWGWLRYRSWLPWVRTELRRVMKISLVQLEELPGVAESP